MQFKDGDLVSTTFCKEGKIRILQDEMFVCHNNPDKNGADPDDNFRYGYKYSWLFYDSEMEWAIKKYNMRKLEVEMQKKKIELYEEDLVLAHDNGCPDVRRVLEQIAPHVFELFTEIKLGDRFKHDDDTYILAVATADDVELINLIHGCRWSTPVKVQNTFTITREEWERIKDGGTFDKITK